jgi:hypothetical protein
MLFTALMITVCTAHTIMRYISTVVQLLSGIRNMMLY